MKRKIIVVSIVLLITLSFAISIKDFRNLQNFQTATVEGVVTVLPNTFGSNIFFIQDKTGGVNIYAARIDFSKLNLKYGELVG